MFSCVAYSTNGNEELLDEFGREVFGIAASYADQVILNIINSVLVFVMIVLFIISIALYVGSDKRGSRKGMFAVSTVVFVLTLAALIGFSIYSGYQRRHFYMYGFAGFDGYIGYLEFLHIFSYVRIGLEALSILFALISSILSGTHRKQEKSTVVYAAPGYGPNPPYGQAPAYGPAPTSGQGPAYGPNPPYGQTPAYGPAPTYGQAPAYGQGQVYGPAPTGGQAPDKPASAPEHKPEA